MTRHMAWWASALLLILLAAGCPSEPTGGGSPADTAGTPDVTDATGGGDDVTETPDPGVEDDGEEPNDADEPDVPAVPETSDTVTPPDTVTLPETTNVPDAPDAPDAPLPDTEDAADAMDSGDVGPPEQESVCDDEVDDDDDGATDCDDDDCALNAACTPTCAPVATVTCGSTTPGDTAGAGATQVLAEYPCRDGFFTGPEQAYQLEVDEPTYVLAELQNKTDQTDLFVLQGKDGACFAGRCTAADIKDVLFVAQPGEPWFLVVDGLDGAVGSYDLVISCEVCTPDCSEKVCGDDGCGGTCGECTGGALCSADGSACVQAAAADSCEEAEALGALPATVSGSTVGALDDYEALGGGCAPAGFTGGPDVVYTFTPASTATYRLTLSGLSFDATLYVVTDCDLAEGTCAAGADLPGDEVIEVGLTGGQPVFIVIDGADEIESGDFSLTVEELGACVPTCDQCGGPDGCGGTCPCSPVDNDTCAEAVAIALDALPATLTGTTGGGTDDYQVLAGQCPGAPGYGFGQGGPDVVYSVTPPAPMTLTFRLPLDSDGYDASLYLVTDCADAGGSCVAGDEFWGLGGEEITATLPAGQTTFVIVDGYKDDQGSYTLEVSQCVPACGGKSCGPDGCGGTCGTCGGDQECVAGTCQAPPVNDTCGTAATIGALPFAAVTTTSGLSDTVAIEANSCAELPFSYELGADDPDAFWTFDPPADGIYTFTVTPLGGWSPAVTVVTDCAAPDTSCQGFAVATQPLHVELTEGTPVFAIVDGDPGLGAYELTVTTCTPSCAGKSCGTDGCGGSCGECEGDDTCFSGQCVTGCLGVSAQGCCEGGELLYCYDDELIVESCPTSCGWNPSQAWYECGYSGEDPNGQHPKACPGQ